MAAEDPVDDVAMIFTEADVFAICGYLAELWEVESETVPEDTEAAITAVLTRTWSRDSMIAALQVCDEPECDEPMTRYDADGQWCNKHYGLAPSRASAHDLAEWVCATLDYLVLDERPDSLPEYVSKPTLARKAKYKVRELQTRGENHVVQTTADPPARDALMGRAGAGSGDLESPGRRPADVADDERAEAAARPDVATVRPGVAEPTHGVRIARGLITHWKDVPITSRAMAAECLGVIEEWTGERGVVVPIETVGISGQKLAVANAEPGMSGNPDGWCTCGAGEYQPPECHVAPCVGGARLEEHDRPRRPDPWPVIEWLAENYPAALELCPYKVTL